MSDQPETIAAILAEFRKFALRAAEEDKMISPESVLLLADKVEAAAERKLASLEDALSHCREYAEKIERENEEGETRLDAEEIIATVDNEFAGIRPARAPCNAAVMREALEWAAQFVELGVDDDLGADGQNLTTAAKMARDALSAPARNCDRFQTADEAVAAFADHLRAWENAHGICSEYPDHPVKVPAGAFAWLFAPAEGGDHA